VNLTGSVATIDMKEKANQPITNTTQAMYNTPGVWINQNNAKPGSDGGTIRIRGVGTMSSSSPMVLVDGMEVGHGAGDSKKEAEQRAAFSVSQYMSDEQCATLLDKVDKLAQ
jgi:outer membrane receptor for ferrienterochelin and colicin